MLCRTLIERKTRAKKEKKHVPCVVRIREGAMGKEKKRVPQKAPRRGAIQVPKEIGGDIKNEKDCQSIA